MMWLPFAFEPRVPGKRDGLERVRVRIDERSPALFALDRRIDPARNELSNLIPLVPRIGQADFVVDAETEQLFLSRDLRSKRDRRIVELVWLRLRFG